MTDAPGFLTTKTPESKCPQCGHLYNAATSLGENARPQPGDISFCIECLALLTFDQRLQLRLMVAEEVEQLKKIPAGRDLLRARAVMKLISKEPPNNRFS